MFNSDNFPYGDTESVVGTMFNFMEKTVKKYQGRPVRVDKLVLKDFGGKKFGGKKIKTISGEILVIKVDESAWESITDNDIPIPAILIQYEGQNYHVNPSEFMRYAKIPEGKYFDTLIEIYYEKQYEYENVEGDDAVEDL